MKQVIGALLSVSLAVGAVYMLYWSVSDTEGGPKEKASGRRRKNKKRKNLPALKLLSERYHAICGSARTNAEKIILLEQLQLTVDAIGGTPKRKQRRKRLNLKIEAAITRLEAAAASSSHLASSSTSSGRDDKAVVIETAKLQRGYKTTADGRTTSFFHRDIDDEAKRLIGSIAPKRISNQNDLAGARLVKAVDRTKKKGRVAGSAWNANGQTWEDRTIFPHVWKKILTDLYNGPFRPGNSNNAELSYSLEPTSTCGDVIMKWKNKVPALIFDITVKLRVLNADKDTLFYCNVYHMSGDDCSIEFTSGTKTNNGPALKRAIRQDIAHRTAQFEVRLKKQQIDEK